MKPVASIALGRAMEARKYRRNKKPGNEALAIALDGFEI
jgi:hypothetical protein